jgi:NAD(P)-dependent dehydrogenase (short-subunit alcohol dehydrogenase family)
VADQARRDRGAPIGGGPGGPLSGRVAIVTGAAGGLGSATVRALRQADAIASMMAEQPARRFVDTTEVAGLITFLAGAGGSAVNGACIPVDTGTLAD